MSTLRLVQISLLMLLLGVLPAHADILTGLMGYWPMDDGTGTTATDASGRSHPGTLVNTPPWSLTTRKVGPASLQFVAASSQRVTVVNHADLNPTTGWTAMVWINATTLTTSNALYKPGSGVVINYRLHLRNTGNIRCTYNDSEFTSTQTFTANTWVHLACTWDGSTIRGYFNGVLDSSTGAQPTALTAQATSLFLGCKDDLTQFVDGYMDEVRLYNRALSQQDIVEAMRFPARFQALVP